MRAPVHECSSQRTAVACWVQRAHAAAHMLVKRHPRTSATGNWPLPLDIFVDAALALQTEKARVFFAHAGLPATRGVEIADGHVALFP